MYLMLVVHKIATSFFTSSAWISRFIRELLHKFCLVLWSQILHSCNPRFKHAEEQTEIKRNVQPFVIWAQLPSVSVQLNDASQGCQLLKPESRLSWQPFSLWSPSASACYPITPFVTWTALSLHFRVSAEESSRLDCDVLELWRL